MNRKRTARQLPTIISYRRFKLYYKLSKSLKHNNIYYFSAIIFVIFGSSCARVGSPTGGEKDSIPPTLTWMNPPLETTNFRSNEITLTFDELIQARDAKKELIITPTIEDYETRVNKRTIRVIINEDLEENTTYTLNFRESIKDITEGNSAEQVVVAFSTGNTIDSCRVSGIVSDLLVGEPIEDAIVALYNFNDTLDIFNSRPLYLTKTDEEGNYEIKYVKEGKYKIYAYIDSNGNLKDESDKEPYAFKSNPIILKNGNPQSDTSSISYMAEVDLQLYGVDARPLEILGARANGKYYELRFNKYVTSYNLEMDTASFQGINLTDSIPNESKYYSPSRIYENFQENHSTLRFYNTFDIDSLQTIIKIEDSLMQQTADTFYVKFEETRRKPEKLTQTFTPDDRKENFMIAGKLEFNKPIVGVTTDSFYLQYDTLVNIPLVEKQDWNWNENQDQILVKKSIDRDSLENALAIKYQEIDSLNRERSVLIQKNLMDSITNTDDFAQKLKFFQDLLEQQNTKSAVKIIDSLSSIESENQKITLINSVIDTLTTGIKIASEEIEIKLDKGYTLYGGKGAFVSIELDSSERVKQEFPFLDPKNFGVIKGKIETEFDSFFLQLTDEKGKVISELKSQKDYTFKNIKPGTYRIRILVDENNDGKWSFGNIIKNEEPEPVFFYLEEIELRANWEREGVDFSF